MSPNDEARRVRLRVRSGQGVRVSAIWSYVLAGIGVTGLWIAASRPKVGFWLNIAAQVLWLAYSLATRQWGFVLSVVAYTVVYVRLLRRAYAATPRKETP